MYPMMITNSHSPNKHPSQQHSNPLLNLNLGLLEPFMLMTFLLFVLCLIEKAKILPVGRHEFDPFHPHRDYEGYNYFMKRNSSDF